MQKTLFAKDVNGSIRTWSIRIIDAGLEMSYGMAGGAMQQKYEHIHSGDTVKTREEKIISRFESRINQQLDKGYLPDLEEVKRSRRKNALGLVRPMLAQPIEKVKGIDYDTAFYQHKYDGNRCLVTKQGGKVMAYSRNGKPVDSIKHILSGIELEEGQTIDGELYCHGVALQTICSWIKREQQATLNLSLRVYDTVENIPYISRLTLLESLTLGEHAQVVPTLRVRNESELGDLMRSSLEFGYEGGILRWGEAGYEDGKRSKSLAKIKVFQDDEFLVVDIERSTDGWAILECITHDGKNFSVSCPGTTAFKHMVAERKHLYIGKKVNVKYANMTKDGIPFHPVATMFRDKDKE